MKRIIICADGTWNEPDQIDEKTGKRHPSNVVKLARAVLPVASDGTPQVVYYHDGVGTGNAVDRITGGAFGDGIEKNIQELYRFLVYNHCPGDSIYLFGFSRGAFTVRSLAGFMYKVGLLGKGDEFFTPDLYALYRQQTKREDAQWQKVFSGIRQPADCPPVKMVGVWDTVGALGAPGLLGQIFNRGKYAYHDVDLNPSIENAVHALALDERRKPFVPSLWNKPPDWQGQLVQAWFPGVHSNVGGGYSPDGLANGALHWMVKMAESTGLQFDEEYLKPYRAVFNSALMDSMTMVYRAMGAVTRPVGLAADGGEAIHQSVLDRMADPQCAYAPGNLASESNAAWRSLPVVP